MTTRLSDERRQVIDTARGRPVHLIDSETNAHSVLLRADDYEKVKAVFECDDSDFDPRESYPFIEQVMREDDDNDPSLACLKAALELR
jgi:hypothetical protein